MPEVHRERRSSPASTSSTPTSTATSAASSSRPTAARGSPTGREMVQGNRADRQAGALVGLHYHLHQADYWYVPFGTARVVLHDLREGGPTDGATLSARPDRGEQPPRRVHPARRRPRLRRAHRHDDHLPGRRLLQPGRRARRGVGRPGDRRRLGRHRPDPVRTATRTNPRRADLAPSAAPVRGPCGPDRATLRHRRRRLHRLELRPPRARAPPTTRSPSSTRSPTPATCANLRDVDDDPRFTFVKGDICDREAVLAAHGRATTPSCTSRPRATSTARSSTPTSSCSTNCDGTNVMCDVARRVGVERFLHISTDEVYGSIEEGSFTETDPLAPRSPYSASKAGSRPDRPLVPHDLRAAGRRHPVVEQLRAVPVPREGHPAVRHQPARRREGAALRRRPQRPRLVLRRGQLRRRRPRARARARSARSTTSAPATRSPTASSPTGCWR